MLEFDVDKLEKLLKMAFAITLTSFAQFIQDSKHGFVSTVYPIAIVQRGKAASSVCALGTRRIEAWMWALHRMT